MTRERPRAGSVEEGTATRTMYVALAVPALAFVGIFYLFPLLRLLLQSVFDPHFTLVHFRHVFADPVYVQILAGTFRTALDVAVITLLVGYPIAYLVASRSQTVANIMLVVILLPFWTSVLIRSYAWIVLLSRNGLINQWLLSVGLVTEPLPMVYNRAGVHIGLVYVALPIMILPLYAALKNINPNLLKAAATLGSSPPYTFWRIILPLSMPGVYSGFTLVFVWTLGAFVTPALLGGMREVLMTGVIDNVMRNTLNWGFAAALSAVLVVATLAAMLFLYKLVGRLALPESR